MKIKYSKELLSYTINKSNSRSELLFNLGIKDGNSQTHLIRKIKEYELDISHFSKTKRGYSKVNIENYFTKDSKVNRGSVKLRIRNENLIPYICECCGQDENWRGKIMPLILDHKDGINNNNELSNLRFLCSNCDSIQDTYKNRNKRVSKELRIKKEEIKDIQKKELKIQNKNKTIENWRIKILESNIDFSKKTWGIEVSKIMKKSPQFCLKFIKQNLNEIIYAVPPRGE